MSETAMTHQNAEQKKNVQKYRQISRKSFLDYDSALSSYRNKGFELKLKYDPEAESFEDGPDAKLRIAHLSSSNVFDVVTYSALHISTVRVPVKDRDIIIESTLEENSAPTARKNKRLRKKERRLLASNDAENA